MPLSHAEARKLIPYLTPLPHEKPGLSGLTNAAFRAANIPEHRIYESSFERGTGYVVAGGNRHWCAVVDDKLMREYAASVKISPYQE